MISKNDENRRMYCHFTNLNLFALVRIRLFILIESRSCFTDYLDELLIKVLGSSFIRIVLRGSVFSTLSSECESRSFIRTKPTRQSLAFEMRLVLFRQRIPRSHSNRVRIWVHKRSHSSQLASSKFVHLLCNHRAHYHLDHRCQLGAVEVLHDLLF